ncbi:hypothetical protein [Butyricicoccus porcorum]
MIRPGSKIGCGCTIGPNTILDRAKSETGQASIPRRFMRAVWEPTRPSARLRTSVRAAGSVMRPESATSSS